MLAHMMTVLNERHGYGLDLFLLSIDEGISGYRDDSLETVKRNEAQCVPSSGPEQIFVDVLLMHSLHNVNRHRVKHTKIIRWKFLSAPRRGLNQPRVTGLGSERTPQLFANLGW